MMSGEPLRDISNNYMIQNSNESILEESDHTHYIRDESNTVNVRTVHYTLDTDGNFNGSSHVNYREEDEVVSFYRPIFPNNRSDIGVTNTCNNTTVRNTNAHTSNDNLMDVRSDNSTHSHNTSSNDTSNIAGDRIRLQRVP